MYFSGCSRTPSLCVRLAAAGAVSLGNVYRTLVARRNSAWPQVHPSGASGQRSQPRRLTGAERKPGTLHAMDDVSKQRIGANESLFRETNEGIERGL